MKDEKFLGTQIIQEYDQLEKLRVTGLEKLLVTYDVLEANHFPEIVESLLSGSIAFFNRDIQPLFHFV